MFYLIAIIVATIMTGFHIEKSAPTFGLLFITAVFVVLVFSEIFLYRIKQNIRKTRGDVQENIKKIKKNAQQNKNKS